MLTRNSIDRVLQVRHFTLVAGRLRFSPKIIGETDPMKISGVALCVLPHQFSGDM
ncbi:MAG: hypothetical protein ABIO19_15225 [Burkholderiaceae bacterium]